ncbi:MAG: SUMF1/EgtB/PvdO family nonheme iron enzyme [Elusimicrobia bacterium]|nr:SUMF1/EgtB/PvdO family nonheme iron enzyme [Elusimicrobiota bacterium]
MAKTEVTVAQYKACVDTGACAAPDTGGSCNWGVSGRESHPVNCVDWNQAKAFSEWADGRLPSEAEWEYAARSAGKDRKYPWGDEQATCARAVTMARRVMGARGRAQRARTGSVVAGRGSTSPSTSGPRSATTVARATSSATSAFAPPVEGSAGINRQGDANERAVR